MSIMSPLLAPRKQCRSFFRGALSVVCPSRIARSILRASEKGTPLMRPTITKKAKITAGFLGLFLALTAAAETKVYITRDKNGNPVYSDRKSADAEDMVVKSLPTVPAMKLSGPDEPEAPRNEAVGYQRISIVSPSSGSTLQAGHAGDTEIAGMLLPGLQEGHSIVLTDNGAEIERGQKPGFAVTNLDRGEHVFVLQVRDGSDKVLISSDPVTLYVHRPSALN